MSQVTIRPSCGSQSKIKEKNSITIYRAVQDEEAFKKIGQLKKAMTRFKKAEVLEKELVDLKTNR